MRGAIFITGATGFVGSEVAEKIAGLGRPVRLLVRGAQVGRSGSAQLVRGDLCEPTSYRAELQDVELVIHLAALTGKASPADYEAINVQATAHLLEAAEEAGVQRFLYVSTIAAGFADQRFNYYSQSKLAAEQLVARSGIAYAIVRPTVVLGQRSPAWATLQRVARLPVIPLFRGSRSVCTQPIHVSDLARAICLLAEEPSFQGEILDLGGREALEMERFLELVHVELSSAATRFFPVPLDIVRPLLGTIEPLVRPVLPVTAGQLSLFANDSVARPNWLLEKLAPSMKDASALISGLVREPSDSGGMGSAPFDPESSESSLMSEARTFAKHLSGLDVDEQVTSHYVRGLRARRLLSVESAFDDLTIRLARRGRILAKLADTYCAIFHRRGTLRRRLILLLAILEQSGATHLAMDQLKPRSAPLALLRLALLGLVAGATAVTSALLLGPAHLILGRRMRQSPRERS